MSFRLLAAPVVALAIAASACAARGPQAGLAPREGTAAVQILGFNDFHGTLDPPTGSNGRIGDVDAGGAAYFATHMARLRAENPQTLVVAAGDLIGASTLLSGLFHDEPTIEALDALGLDAAAVGNHEFDEGWAELIRMQRGGCHPVDGCQDGTPFAGARFEYLAANVTIDPERVDPRALQQSGWRADGPGPHTLLPAFTIREVAGVKVGIIGLVVEETSTLVSPAGIRGITFHPEVSAGNAAVAALAARGVKTIVVVIHEGGYPATRDVNGCGVSGPIVAIANGLSDEVDVIVSGHSHEAYVCTLGTKLLTSAASYGRLITDIDLTIDRATGDVLTKQARNVVVTRDVAPHPAMTTLLDWYRPFAESIGGRDVGAITAPITRVATVAGESALGDLVADAMLAASTSAPGGGAVLALWNPGGIRADLVGRPPASPGAPSIVTFGDAFNMLPFGNELIVRTMTGAAIVDVLEQQFRGRRLVLQVSRGFAYTYDSSKPEGQRVDVASITIDGRPLDPAGRYRVATSNFLWNGGDAFTFDASDPVVVGVDVDLFIDYLRAHSPLAPGPRTRITRVE